LAAHFSRRTFPAAAKCAMAMGVACVCEMRTSKEMERMWMDLTPAHHHGHRGSAQVGQVGTHGPRSGKPPRCTPPRPPVTKTRIPALCAAIRMPETVVAPLYLVMPGPGPRPIDWFCVPIARPSPGTLGHARSPRGSVQPTVLPSMTFCSAMQPFKLCLPLHHSPDPPLHPRPCSSSDKSSRMMRGRTSGTA
jgi:hypothetical protein